MFIDASALAAILLGEPDGEDIAEVIDGVSRAGLPDIADCGL